jgi:hypothetical protein
MSEEQKIKKVSKALEMISNDLFDQVMEMEKNHSDNVDRLDFYNMLEKSPYFKSLFFRGFIEGVNFEKSNTKIVI